MNKILLLEDEESVSRGICFTLEKVGFQVYVRGIGYILRDGK